MVDRKEELLKPVEVKPEKGLKGDKGSPGLTGPLGADVSGLSKRH